MLLSILSSYQYNIIWCFCSAVSFSFAVQSYKELCSSFYSICPYICILRSTAFYIECNWCHQVLYTEDYGFSERSVNVQYKWSNMNIAVILWNCYTGDKMFLPYFIQVAKQFALDGHLCSRHDLIAVFIMSR